jgi:hypothetical protein
MRGRSMAKLAVTLSFDGFSSSNVNEMLGTADASAFHASKLE